MKKLIRKLAIKFFRKRIKVFYVSRVLDNYLISHKDYEDIERETKRRMLYDLVDKIYEENLIDFEEEKDISTNNRVFRAKIRLI